jgi:DNA-binding SARP family transcriptional activator
MAMRIREKSYMSHRGTPGLAREQWPRASRIGLRLVGGFELSLSGVPVALPGGAQRLIAFLALQSGPVRRAYVAGSLWPEATDERASARLRTALWSLRRVWVGLVEGIQTLGIAHSAHVDLNDAIEAAHRVIRDPGGALRTEAHVPALYGDVLPDWHEEWVVLERERFREVRVRALEALSGLLAEQCRFDEAALMALAAIRAEPLRESAHRALIAVHLSEGNRHAATAQFRRLRWLLNSELGIEPSRHTFSMVRDIVRPGAWRGSEHARTIRGRSRRWER